MKRNILQTGYDIIIFDCDSTLSAIEGIDLLAERHNVKKQVEEITNGAMNGHNSFAKALDLRLKLVQPTREDLFWLGQEYIKNVVPGTKSLINNLRKTNKEVFMISGGFEAALRIFADYIGIDQSKVFSNVLIFDNEGKYLGFDKKNPLSKNHGKKIMLEKIAVMGKTLFVGDGVTDLEAKEVVDLFVGFGGVKTREIVRKEADIFIQEKTLKRINDIALGHIT